MAMEIEGTFDGKISFKIRIQNARDEIQSKYLEFHSQLTKEESRLITRLDDIESEVLETFEKYSTSLNEITKAREQILSIFKTNTTNRDLLRNNLEIYDKEIQAIKENTKIENIINLEWDIKPIEINCLIQTKNCPPQTTQHAIPQLLKQVSSPLPNTLDSKYQRLNSYQGNAPRKHFMKMPKQTEWECPHCTTLNSMSNHYCEICYKTPRYKIDKQSGKPNIPHGTKYCRRCNQANRYQDQICAYCGLCICRPEMVSVESPGYLELRISRRILALTMAQSPQISETTLQTITEFQTRIQSYRAEIKNKISQIIGQLKNEENQLLSKLDDIEKEVLDKYKIASSTLAEITKAREHILGVLKSNTTSTLLKNNLELYDKEIENIKKNSIISSTNIQLKWNINNIENICVISKLIDENRENIINSKCVETDKRSVVYTEYLKPLKPKFQVPEPNCQNKNLLKLNRHLVNLEDNIFSPDYSTDKPNNTITEPQYTNLSLKREWVCPNCTYYNDPSLTKCGMCSYLRQNY
ncbi:hypothetical protein LOD99_8874 [Oopsacas minuta]|uniref:RanBP2-type domain-containing protein n=1 Tax=Oopsacas minuta TaxID=111878 RepID=A0AAV7JEM6_9METZ|nr:hypothetical protein LOD99_8874 [Oopsacas minuta]